MKSINTLASIARINKLEPTRNRLRNDIVEEYTKITSVISRIEESIITNDTSLLPIYKIEEGYAIDLDSLKYVVESKKIILDEAIQEFKTVNNIEENASVYCVLPKNINENMTIESFITLNNTLSKANITPISNKSINLEDFIEESSNSNNEKFHYAFVIRVSNSVRSLYKMPKFEENDGENNVIKSGYKYTYGTLDMKYLSNKNLKDANPNDSIDDIVEKYVNNMNKKLRKYGYTIDSRRSDRESGYDLYFTYDN